jgi:hypothetical protein
MGSRTAQPVRAHSVQQAPGLEALDMHEQVYEAPQGALDIT